MSLSKQAISDFRAVYKKRFGVDLPDDEAEKKFLDLLHMMKILCRHARPATS